MSDFRIKLHVEMWQSQSYWPLKGWSSPLSGLPHFTSVLLPPSGLEQFPKDLLPPLGWAWDGEWRIDSSPQNGGTDQSGWCYASNFDKLKSYLKINKPIGTSTKTSMVRTRRWIRLLECSDDKLNDFLMNRISCLQHYREAVEIVLRKKQSCVQEIIRYEEYRKKLFTESVEEISSISLLTFSNIQSLGIQLKFFEKFIQGRIESEKSFLKQFEKSFPHVALPSPDNETNEINESNEDETSTEESPNSPSKIHENNQTYNSVLHKTDSIPQFSLSDTPLPDSYISLSNINSSKDVASFYASPISDIFFKSISSLSEIAKKSSIEMINSLENLLKIQDEEGDSLSSILAEIELLLKEQRDLFRKNSDICRFSEIAVRNFLTSINIAFESITHNCLYDVSFLTEELSILNGTVPFLPAYFLKVKEYGTLPSSDLHNAFLSAITNSLRRSQVQNNSKSSNPTSSGPIKNIIKNRRESFASSSNTTEESSRTMSTVSSSSTLLSDTQDEAEHKDIEHDNMLNDIMRQREHFQWNLSSTIPDIIEPYNYHQPNNSSSSTPNYFTLSLGQPRDDLWLSLQRYLLAVKESQTSLGSLLEALCYLDQSLQIYARKAHKMMTIMSKNYSNFELEQGLGIKNNEKISIILKELLKSIETVAYPTPASHTKRDTPQFPSELISLSEDNFKIPSLSCISNNKSSSNTTSTTSDLAIPPDSLPSKDSYSPLFSYLKLYELKFPSNPMVIFYDNLIYMSKSKFRSMLKDPNSSYLTTFNDTSNWEEIFAITTSDGYLHLFFNNELAELPTKSFYLKQCVVNEIIKSHGNPNTHQYIFDISLNTKNKRVGSNILHDGGIFKCLDRNSYHKWLEILPRLTLLPCNICEDIEEAVKESLEEGRPRFPFERILPFEDYVEKVKSVAISNNEEISDNDIPINQIAEESVHKVSPPTPTPTSDPTLTATPTPTQTPAPTTALTSNPLATSKSSSRGFSNSLKDRVSMFEKKNLTVSTSKESSPQISPSLSPANSFPSPRLKTTDVVIDNSKYVNNKPKPTQPYNPYPISPNKMIKINKKLSDNYEELSTIVMIEEAEKNKEDDPYFVYSNEFLSEKPERRVSNSLLLGSTPISTDLKPAQILPLNYDSSAPLARRKSVMIDQYQQGLEADKQRSLSKVKQTRGRTLRDFNITDKLPEYLKEELAIPEDDEYSKNNLYPTVSIDELAKTLKEQYVEEADNENENEDEAQL